MTKKLRAVFDGKVLRPDDTSGLTPNARYMLTVEPEPDDRRRQEGGTHPLTEILSLATDMGVTDLSTRHSWYAHGRLEDGERGA